MDRNLGYGGSGVSYNWQDSPRPRGRGGGWHRPWNPSDNYRPPRPGGWNHRPPFYYRDQNYHHHHRGGGFRHRPQYTDFPRAQLQIDQTDIGNWISPEMWEDPWADLMQQYNPKNEIDTQRPTTPVSHTPADAVEEEHHDVTYASQPTKEALVKHVSEESKAESYSRTGITMLNDLVKVPTIENSEESSKSHSPTGTTEMTETTLGSPTYEKELFQN